MRGRKNEAEGGGSRLLDEVCALGGYERKYAIKVLGGKRPMGGSGKRRRGGSPARYGAPEREVIKSIWLRAEQPSNLAANDSSDAGVVAAAL